MRQIMFSAVALCMVSAASAARAADTVGEVVVTATRLPAPVDLVPGARVITREDLDQTGAATAEDALNTLPGVSAFQTGAFGGVTSVRIRGASSDKTLVLVDGVPVDDPSQPSGAFDFAGFDAADIARIEVLNGPQGSLWGSSAIGGVVSITTREPGGVDASVEAGSLRTARGSVAVGRRTDDWALGLTAAAVSTRGVSSADSADGNPEPDSFHSQSIGASARLKVNADLTLDAKARWSGGESGIDGFVFDPATGGFRLADTTDVMRRQSWQGYVRAGWKGPLGFTHHVSASDYRIDRSDAGPSGDFAYVADRRVLRWQAERDRPGEPLALTMGAEREDTRAELSDGARRRAGASSAFVVARASPVSRLTISGSLRWDRPDGHSGVGTGRASGVLQLGAGFAAQASWGQGFKLPTISEQACDFCFPPGPALGLKPERALGWDAGLKWRSADRRYAADVAAFRLDVRDQIDFAFDPATFGFRYANIERTRSRGLEAAASAELGADVSARATWTRTEAVNATTGAPLLRVPKTQGSLVLAWTGAQGRAAVTLRAESRQADVGDLGVTERPGFVTADLAGGWRINEHVEATLRVVDLANVRWQEALGYGEPRRSAWAGIRLRY